MVGSVLEELRELLAESKTHVEIGRILQKEFAPDRSVLRVKALILPENYEVIARVTWGSVGDGDGIFGPIKEGDLALFVMADGDEDETFCIARFSSKIDKIPEMAVEDHTVVRAIPEKKLYLGSDTKTLVQKNGSLTDPLENVVLGQVLKTLLVDILSELSLLSQNIIEHTHIGNLGIQTTVPNNNPDFEDNKSVFDAKKASPVQDELILSDIFFTEKGN